MAPCSTHQLLSRIASTYDSRFSSQICKAAGGTYSYWKEIRARTPGSNRASEYPDPEQKTILKKVAHYSTVLNIELTDGVGESKAIFFCFVLPLCSFFCCIDFFVLIILWKKRRTSMKWKAVLFKHVPNLFICFVSRRHRIIKYRVTMGDREKDSEKESGEVKEKGQHKEKEGRKKREKKKQS